MAKEKATNILLGLPSGGDKNKQNGFKNKWIYLSGVLLLALLAVTYKLYFQEACPQINFELSSIENSDGAMFKFYDFTPGVSSWEWDFGDNTGVSSERNPIHLYKQAGTYDVLLTINGECSKFQTVTIIRESPEGIDTPLFDSTLITSVDSADDIPLDSSLTVDIDAPPPQVTSRLVAVPDPSISTSQPVARRTPSRSETKTRPQSTPSQTSNISQQSSIRQQDPNDRERPANRQITDQTEGTEQSEDSEVGESLDNNPPRTDVGYVANEPEPYKSPSDEAVADVLTDLDIKTMVFDVSELRQLPSDVMSSLCKGSFDRTIVDANNTTMSMGDFFERIEGKPIRIKSFIVHRDPSDNNCIVGMKIKYGKIGLF